MEDDSHLRVSPELDDQIRDFAGRIALVTMPREQAEAEEVTIAARKAFISKIRHLHVVSIVQQVGADHASEHLLPATTAATRLATALGKGYRYNSIFSGGPLTAVNNGSSLEGAVLSEIARVWVHARGERTDDGTYGIIGVVDTEDLLPPPHDKIIAPLGAAVRLDHIGVNQNIPDSFLEMQWKLLYPRS